VSGRTLVNPSHGPNFEKHGRLLKRFDSVQTQHNQMSHKASRASSAVWFCAWLATWLSFPGAAWARPSEHIAIELEAPTPCPDAAAILQRVDAQLGAAFETDSRLRVVLSIQAVQARDYTLQLRYETSSGDAEQRQLSGESCEEVLDAAALVLAVALNPSSLGTTVEPRVADVSPATTPRTSRAHVAALAELDTALFQRASVAFGAQLGVRIGPIELRARAQLFLPRSIVLADTTTTFNAFSFDLAACVPYGLGWIGVAGCIRGELGRMAAKPAGTLEDPRPGNARFQAVGAGAELRVRVVEPLWLALGADFAWFLRRPRFVVTDLGEIGRPAALGVRAYFGPHVAW
jgi:hypothetical protein